MSDEEEFDSEKTQFWLPGQALPERPVADPADDDKGAGYNKKPRQDREARGQASDGTATNADQPGGAIDFDLTAEQPGSGELDLDLSSAADTSTMDFDITGEGTIPPQSEAAPQADAPAAAARPTPTPAPAPAASSSGAGGAMLIIAVVVIAAGLIYFFTR